MKNHHTQSGAVLIISLLILVVMTILGVTAMSSTALQERMASNDRQRMIAMQTAEAALRDAEDWLETNIIDLNSLMTNFDGTANELYINVTTAGCVETNRTGWDIYEPTNWGAGNSQAISTSIASVQNQPRYIIEYLGRAKPSGGRAGALDPNDSNNVCGGDPFDEYAFRITARGQGDDAAATHLAQSYYFIPGPL